MCKYFEQFEYIKHEISHYAVIFEKASNAILMIGITQKRSTRKKIEENIYWCAEPHTKIAITVREQDQKRN